MTTIFHKIYPLGSRPSFHTFSRFLTRRNEYLAQKNAYSRERCISSTPGPPHEPHSVTHNELDTNVDETEPYIDLMKTEIWGAALQIKEDYDVPTEEYQDPSTPYDLVEQFHPSNRQISEAAFADLPIVKIPGVTDRIVIASCRWALGHAIRNGKPWDVLEAAVRLASISAASIAALTPEEFTELLQRIDPVVLVGRYKEIQKSISPGLAYILSIPPVDRSGLNYYAATFMAYLRIIVQARKFGGGNSLSMEDYKHFLKCAREVGDINQSREIWKELSSEDLTPDLDCYNHHLSTIVWAELLNNMQRHQVRVTRETLALRGWRRRPQAFHRVFEGHRVGFGGIKNETTLVFNEMIHNGITGDEETFCSLMVAMAREGDLKGVATILHKVWNIDAGRIGNPNTMDNEMQPLTKYEPNSPFYPSQKLLFCVAHIYGINNEAHRAIRLVDFIASQYSITISTPVWEELVERVVTLSTKLGGVKNRRDDRIRGYLSSSALQQLWDVMTNSPYNVEPTLFMWNKLICNMLGWQLFDKVQGAIREAKKAYRKSKVNYQLAFEIFETAPDEQKAKLARECRYQEFVLKRNQMYWQHWSKWWLKRISHHLEFQPWRWHLYRDIPTFLLENAPALPSQIRYRIRTGYVSFGKWQMFENVLEDDWRLTKDRYAHDEWNKYRTRAQGGWDDDGEEEWV